MLFSITDVVLILAVFGFAMIGFMMGLIAAVGALVGVIVGAWAASLLTSPVATWLAPYIMDNEGLAKVIAFIAVFALVNRAVSFIFWMLGKIFNIVSIIPFLKTIDRAAGAILGLIEGILATGVIIFVIAKFGQNIGWLADQLNSSQVAHWLVAATSFLSSLVGSII